MNALLSAIISIILYPGIVVALIAAIVLGWLRGTSRAALSGWSGLSPLVSLRQIVRRQRQASTLPEGTPVLAIQGLPVVALVCPLVVLAFVPLPGNRGLGAANLSLDVAAAGALLLGMPLARIALGWAVPSPYTRLAAMRSARRLAGYALPLGLAIATAAVLSGQLTIAGISTTLTRTGSATLLIDVARALAGLAFLLCAPGLVRLSTLRGGMASGELLAGELTEISGRELLVMQVAEAVQLVAFLAVGIALFVLPFWSSNGARGLAAIVAFVAGTVAIGAWEGIEPRVRTRDEYSMPFSVWLGTPMYFGIFGIIALLLARIIH
jgi:NADH-quinone oxidoreductase subunit H